MVYSNIGDITIRKGLFNMKKGHKTGILWNEFELITIFLAFSTFKLLD